MAFTLAHVSRLHYYSSFTTICAVNQMVARGNGFGNCLDLNKTRVKLFPNFTMIFSNIMGEEIVSNRDF